METKVTNPSRPPL